MIERLLSRTLRRRLALYPAVAIVGPRQAGKTTLGQSLGGRYFDLEQESGRLRLDLAWEEVVRGADLAVLDEAQECPEVFPRLRGAVDGDRKRTGRFLLLGSVSPALMKHVSESLAGRLALLELSPFLFPELRRVPLDALWLRGGYADGGILGPDRYPGWQRDYLSLLAQRDLPNWGLPAKPQVTERLLRMLAAVHGQIWNASRIGQSLGLTYSTVNSYLDYLEGAFLIRRLSPYEANLKKRLVKSPRVYWRDSGLLHALLDVAGMDDLLARPWVGASWEGFVIDQVLGLLRALDLHARPYFFRTSDGHEIDLVLDFGRETWALEVKLTSQPTTEHVARLRKAADMIGARRRFLISQAARTAAGRDLVSCSLPWFLRFLEGFARRASARPRAGARASRSRGRARAARRPAAAGRRVRGTSSRGARRGPSSR